MENNKSLVAVKNNSTNSQEKWQNRIQTTRNKTTTAHKLPSVKDCGCGLNKSG